MSVFHIVCVYRVDVSKPQRHSHLVAVGTVDSGESTANPTATWTAAEVERAISAGHQFTAEGSGNEVRAIQRPCPLCGVACLKPEPHNSLENIKQCMFH